ncbi:hypothetical protein, partial [Burkholderia thailandensis]|uniref:hypothetical protein n=1 Tax=Burkholderia thailandensis TaxID=57975 RepID=UPI001CA5227D
RFRAAHARRSHPPRCGGIGMASQRDDITTKGAGRQSNRRKGDCAPGAIALLLQSSQTHDRSGLLVERCGLARFTVAFMTKRERRDAAKGCAGRKARTCDVNGGPSA